MAVHVSGIPASVIGACSALGRQPRQGFARYRRRYCVAALELAIDDIVPSVAHSPDDLPAARIDRQYLVLRPMRDEEPRLTPLGRRHHEAWRERDHVREQISIRDAEREGVGCSIGEAADGDSCRIDDIPR